MNALPSIALAAIWGGESRNEKALLFLRKSLPYLFFEKSGEMTPAEKIKLLKIARVHDLIFQVVGANQVY